MTQGMNFVNGAGQYLKSKLDQIQMGRNGVSLSSTGAQFDKEQQVIRAQLAEAKRQAVELGRTHQIGVNTGLLMDSAEQSARAKEGAAQIQSKARAVQLIQGLSVLSQQVANRLQGQFAAQQSVQGLNIHPGASAGIRELKGSGSEPAHLRATRQIAEMGVRK